MLYASALLLASSLVATTTASNLQLPEIVVEPTGVLAKRQHVTGTKVNDNAAGAFITPTVKTNQFQRVEGTIQVPQPHRPKGQTGAGIWGNAGLVELDGFIDQSSTLRGILLWSVNYETATSAPVYSYSAFAQLFPSAPQQVTGFNFTAGDEVSISCSSATSTSGSCDFYNGRTGAKATSQVSAPNGSSARLAGGSAGWAIVTYSQGSPVPYADFGYDLITGCSAYNTHGNQHILNNVELATLELNGKNISTCTLESTDCIACHYEG